MLAISSLHIYSEPRCRTIDFSEVAAHAKNTLGIKCVILRGPLIEDSIDGQGPLGRRIPAEGIARTMAKAKVKTFDAQLGEHSVLPGEIDYEMRRLADRENCVFGILYDAHAVADLFAGLIPADESTIDCLNVVFTNQLIGTWDSSDRRYHARSVLLSAPSIASVSGMVEAPARARGYYLARRSAEILGYSEEEKRDMALSFAEDCLKYDDKRLTEVSKGFVMQAAAYRLTGRPFCNDPACRLFNSHWQRDLLSSQLDGPYEFCGEHRKIFRQIRFQG